MQSKDSEFYSSLLASTKRMESFEISRVLLEKYIENVGEYPDFVISVKEEIQKYEESNLIPENEDLNRDKTYEPRRYRKNIPEEVREHISRLKSGYYDFTFSVRKYIHRQKLEVSETPQKEGELSKNAKLLVLKQLGFFDLPILGEIKIIKKRDELVSLLIGSSYSNVKKAMANFDIKSSPDCPYNSKSIPEANELLKSVGLDELQIKDEKKS